MDVTLIDTSTVHKHIYTAGVSWLEIAEVEYYSFHPGIILPSFLRK